MIQAGHTVATIYPRYEVSSWLPVRPLPLHLSSPEFVLLLHFRILESLILSKEVPWNELTYNGSHQLAVHSINYH